MSANPLEDGTVVRHPNIEEDSKVASLMKAETASH